MLQFISQGRLICGSFACLIETGPEEVSCHPCQAVGGHDISGLGGGDHLFIRLISAAFTGGNKAGAHIGKVCPHGLCRGNIAAGGKRPGQDQQPVKHLPDFMQQRKRVHAAGMAACPRGHCNNTVNTCRSSLFGMAAADHIMEDNATIAVNGLDHA